MAKNTIVGIDASRNHSGGAVAHIRGLISGGDPLQHGIKHVHLWAYDSLLNAVEDQVWLTKHRVPELKLSIWQQLKWQYISLPKLAKTLNCNVMFNTVGSSICPLKPSVTLSQNMLPFEPGEIQRYGFSKDRLRLEVLKYIQIRSLRKATRAIFLSEYARTKISQKTGPLKNSVVIGHGVDESFRNSAIEGKKWTKNTSIRCLYVSNAAPYKHQWHVVAAFAKLRELGYKMELTLIGGGSGKAYTRLLNAVEKYDPQSKFVKLLDFAPNTEIPIHLAKSDLFVFASSCENLPITMLEAMASGIPICASNRGPMPELLGIEGCYFDPERPDSIVGAVKEMIGDPKLRKARSKDSLARSQKYTWQKCAEETWNVLANIS